jgi:L-fuconolactonase
MMRIDAHQHFWVYDQREYAWIDDSMASLVVISFRMI